MKHFQFILCGLHMAHMHNIHQHIGVICLLFKILRTIAHYVAKSAQPMMHISTVYLTLTVKEFSVMGFHKLQRALFSEINILCIIHSLFI